MAPVVITGVRTYSDVYPRLDILDMHKKHPKQFSLFIQAWSTITKPGYQPTAAQFEQIGAIHGLPYVPWPGDPDEAPQTSRGRWLGYCNHASILFPTWHRPYVMLLEQIICEVAQGVAGRYIHETKDPKEKAEWQKAARELRFPFWDWLHKDTSTSGFPQLFKDEKLKLVTPSGDIPYDNVLAFYKFNNNSIDGFRNRLLPPGVREPKLPMEMAYFKEWNRTYRRPNSDPVIVEENYNAMNQYLAGKGPGGWASLTNSVAGMFRLPIDIRPELRANAWDEFSNTTFQSGRRDKENPACFHSPYVWNIPPIEQPHNLVHVVVGGLGHMADPDTAGFDPIFYLHHCNVDRLLSFWEHIYPDYVAGTEGYLDVDGMTRVPFVQSGGTFIQATSQVVDSESPLTPFRKSDYTYWNSKDTHTLSFNKDSGLRNKYYTYPPIGKVELNPKKPPTIEEREEQRRFLQEHFKYDPLKSRDARPLIKHELFEKRAPYGDTPPPGNTAVENYRQFFIRASLSPVYVDGSYLLTIALEINKQSVEVGSIAVFARGSDANCGNCQVQREADARVRGVIIIPYEVVVGIIEAAPFEPKAAESSMDIIENIKSSLQPRVVLPSGEEYSRMGDTLSAKREDSAPELRLFSSDLCQPNLGTRDGQPIPAPFNSYDWKDHGTLRGGWVTVG